MPSCASSPRCSDRSCLPAIHSHGLQLDAPFADSKTAIINTIKKGVEIFHVNRPTCLRPDWSTNWVGHFLLQKHFTCAHITPDCCQGDWCITLAGSRFLTTAEQRYAPIEREALAIAWGLEQTKFFKMGCDHLIVATDHKPLVKIFGDWKLDEIPNTRLFRLKQRILPWRFDIMHLPGSTNFVADSTSWHPSSNNDVKMESMIAASIRRKTEIAVAFTWERLVTESQKDPTMSS